MNKFRFVLTIQTLILLISSACQNSAPGVAGAKHASPQQHVPAASHDLSRDEEAGGHTLRKHIGRSDEELRQRLERERGISAASTYTDRATAEEVVGTMLAEARPRIERWLNRSGNRPNLALEYHGSSPIGRTLYRSETETRPCSDAVVVLRWNGDHDYYVLTSYPECR